MLKLDSSFHTCAPPLSIYGKIGIKHETPYKSSNLVKKMSEIVENYTDTVRQAYDIVARIKTPNNNFLSCELKPLDLTLSDYSVDFDMRKIKFIQKLSKLLLLQNKECGLWTQGTPEGLEVYVMQFLKENFDPVTTELLLEGIERTILSFLKKRHNIDYRIQKNILEVNAKVLSPEDLYIV